MKYSQERKQAVLAKLAPPHQRTVKDVTAEAGISPATLYHWREQARLNGGLLPDDGAASEGWTARDKFTAVMETAALNESACPARSRRAPSTAESVDSIQQITAWRRACESATDWAGERGQQQAAVDRDARKKVRVLERELQRKEKALTETAALLTLSKKARALWGEGEDA